MYTGSNIPDPPDILHILSSALDHLYFMDKKYDANVGQESNKDKNRGTYHNQGVLILYHLMCGKKWVK